MLRKTIALAVSALSIVALSQPVSAAPGCNLAASTRVPELGTFYGHVIDIDTRKQLFAMRADEPTPSASVLKILTGVAAIMNLPAKFTVATKVYSVAGAPGTVVLQGAGDPTLSRLMPPSYSTYPKPARLPRLATQTLAALPAGTKITKIIVDDSYFEGPAYNPWWRASDRTNGYVSPITALQVDAARMNPDLTDRRYSGIRSSTPTTQAAALFKKALGPQALAASIEPLPKKPLQLTELTSVTSSTVEAWVDHGMKFSDNTEVEFIARQVSKWRGFGSSHKSIEPMMKETLYQLGVNSKGLVMKDASGLAQGNRVTARLITETMLALEPFSPAIGNFSSYLATTTSAGTLSTRFKGANKLPASAVQAKTGFIPGLYSLAGYVTAKDGHRLVFAFFARGGGIGGATRTKLDSLVVKAFTCGAKLTT